VDTCYAQSVILGLGPFPMRRRGGRVAADGARAASRGTGDRLPQQFVACGSCAFLGRIPRGSQGDRICRGAKRHHRIPLGRGRYDRLPDFAADLVKRGIAVLVATGGAVTALAAKAATTTIPIVFSAGADPVEIGLIAGLSRPGSNLTGVSLL